MTRLVSFALLAVIAAACATGAVFQDAPPPPEGKALVYLMRPVVGGGSFFNSTFTIDGQEVVSLANNGYSWVVLDAGPHEVVTQNLNAKPLRMSMVVSSGQTYYVEVREAETVGWDTRQDWLREIPASIARPALERMKYKPAAPAAQ